MYLRYNYVVIGTDNDFYEISYNDIKNTEFSRYINKRIYLQSKLINFLHKAHTNPNINKLIDLPFKGFWNRFVFKDDFNEDKPICFLFFGRNLEIDNGIIQYLKVKYKKSKFVYFFQDLVSKSPSFKQFNANELFDIILTFDHNDARKYGYLYYPLVYSLYSSKKNNTFPESDLYYVGKAKDRLNTILDVYKLFTSCGYRCDFHITDVNDKSQMIYPDKISYNKPISYVENLERIKATNCMLEIMQGGGSGYTLRYCEAIMYDKKIITNNKEILKADFYDDKLIQYFSQPSDIDITFPKSGQYAYNIKFKENLSPINLLKFIDARI